MCPIRPVGSGDSKSSGCINGHCHIHIPAVLLTVKRSKKNSTASRAGTGTPRHPATTLAVEAQCKEAANRGSGQKHRETPPL